LSRIGTFRPKAPLASPAWLLDPKGSLLHAQRQNAAPATVCASTGRNSTLVVATTPQQRFDASGLARQGPRTSVLVAPDRNQRGLEYGAAWSRPVGLHLHQVGVGCPVSPAARSWAREVVLRRRLTHHMFAASRTRSGAFCG